MDQVTLSGGDMGGTVVETDVALGGELLVVSKAGESAGQTLRYRRDHKDQAVYTGTADREAVPEK